MLYEEPTSNLAKESERKLSVDLESSIDEPVSAESTINSVEAKTRAASSPVSSLLGNKSMASDSKMSTLGPLPDISEGNSDSLAQKTDSKDSTDNALVSRKPSSISEGSRHLSLARQSSLGSRRLSAGQRRSSLEARQSFLRARHPSLATRHMSLDTLSSASSARSPQGSLLWSIKRSSSERALGGPSSRLHSPHGSFKATRRAALISQKRSAFSDIARSSRGNLLRDLKGSSSGSSAQFSTPLSAISSTRVSSVSSMQYSSSPNSSFKKPNDSKHVPSIRDLIDEIGVMLAEEEKKKLLAKDEANDSPDSTKQTSCSSQSDSGSSEANTQKVKLQSRRRRRRRRRQLSGVSTCSSQSETTMSLGSSKRSLETPPPFSSRQRAVSDSAAARNRYPVYHRPSQGSNSGSLGSGTSGPMWTWRGTGESEGNTSQRSLLSRFFPVQKSSQSKLRAARRRSSAAAEEEMGMVKDPIPRTMDDDSLEYDASAFFSDYSQTKTSGDETDDGCDTCSYGSSSYTNTNSEGIYTRASSWNSKISSSLGHALSSRSLGLGASSSTLFPASNRSLAASDPSLLRNAGISNLSLSQTGSSDPSLLREVGVSGRSLSLTGSSDPRLFCSAGMSGRCLQAGGSDPSLLCQGGISNTSLSQTGSSDRNLMCQRKILKDGSLEDGLSDPSLLKTARVSDGNISQSGSSDPSLLCQASNGCLPPTGSSDPKLLPTDSSNQNSLRAGSISPTLSQTQSGIPVLPTTDSSSVLQGNSSRDLAGEHIALKETISPLSEDAIQEEDPNEDLCRALEAGRSLSSVASRSVTASLDSYPVKCIAADESTEENRSCRYVPYSSFFTKKCSFVVMLVAALVASAFLASLLVDQRNSSGAGSVTDADLLDNDMSHGGSASETSPVENLRGGPATDAPFSLTTLNPTIQSPQETLVKPTILATNRTILPPDTSPNAENATLSTTPPSEAFDLTVPDATDEAPALDHGNNGFQIPGGASTEEPQDADGYASAEPQSTASAEPQVSNVDSEATEPPDPEDESVTVSTGPPEKEALDHADDTEILSTGEEPPQDPYAEITPVGAEEEGESVSLENSVAMEDARKSRQRLRSHKGSIVQPLLHDYFSDGGG